MPQKIWRAIAKLRAVDLAARLGACDCGPYPEMLLGVLGADVHVAPGGPTPLAAFDAYQPAIVLLDIGMPVMDGYEVARAIRSRADRTHAPLVALTGWGRDADRRLAREAGFDHHLVKPAGSEAPRALLGSLGACSFSAAAAARAAPGCVAS